MTALSDDEIEPGIVVWLDQVALNDDSSVIKTTPHLGTPEARPFLCVARDGNESVWVPVTTARRPERLELLGEWRSGGGPGWRTRDQFLVDGANTYRGPSQRFIDASAGEFSDASGRMRLSVEGVKAVVAEVERQRPRRLPGT